MDADVVKFDDDGYNEDLLREVKELALLGHTEEQMVKVLGVPMHIFQSWKRDPRFMDNLLEGRDRADAKVAAALYKRATGYEYMEEQTSYRKGEPFTLSIKKHIPADPWSAARWLSTRQRATWTEKTITEINQTRIDITKLDLSGISDEQLLVLRKYKYKIRH